MEIEKDDNQIILPGEKLPISSQDTTSYNLHIEESFKFLKVKISKDFKRNGEDLTIQAKKSGILIEKNKKKSKILGLHTNCHKYFPDVGDYIIGIIKSKIGESYILDINGVYEGCLGFYEFEGATKRNRPMLNIGDLIYSRVTENNKFLMTKLSCMSMSNKKEWMTGEAFFGELKEGMIMDFPINFCRKLINDKKAEILNLIKNYVTFDICIGMNGR